MSSHDDELESTEALVSPAGGMPPMVVEVGSRLADRFEVIRLIASGGMGTVYEAQDTELSERVALKTIRPERQGDRSVARFKREISLARRVTHPNVCRTFDLFQHQAPGRAPLLFVTMELLQGETLMDRIRQRGSLAPEEAEPLAAQICEGLEAAHRAGVVHRDLKSANVLLVRDTEHDGGAERAVITDFGIAQGPEYGDDGGLTATGRLLGTPFYLAPEQVRGDTIGPWTDIYSLGVVLFEMVTGERPFQGTGPLSIATQRLERPPPALNELCPGIDPRWVSTVQTCLALRPAERFQRAGDVAASLRKEPTRQAFRPIWGVTAALLLALGLWWLAPRDPAPAGPKAELALEAPWLDRALQGLAAGDALTRPASAEAAQAYAAGLEALRRGDATRARESLLRAVEVEPEFALAWLGLARAWKASGYDQRARRSAARADELGSDLPREYRLLVEVESHRLNRDHSLAEEKQGALVTFFPDNPEYLLELARTQIDGTRTEAALATLARLDANGSLEGDPRPYLLEAQARMAREELTLAAEAAAKAIDVAQANGWQVLEARALRLLAQAERRRGETEVAVDLYREAREGFAAAGDPGGVASTLVAEAIVRRRQGALDDAEALYDRALAFYLQAGDLSGQATVILNRANLRLEGGQTEEAIALYRHSLDLYRELEDEASQALVASNLGSALLDSERVEEAVAQLQASLESYRRLGSRGGQGATAINLGNAFLQQGKLEDAEVAFEQAREFLEAAEDTFGLGLAINNLGRVALQRQDLAAAEAHHRRALEMFRDLNAPSMQAHALYGLGEVSRARGNLELARHHHQAALELRQALGRDTEVEQSQLILEALEPPGPAESSS